MLPDRVSFLLLKRRVLISVLNRSALFGKEKRGICENLSFTCHGGRKLGCIYLPKTWNPLHGVSGILAILHVLNFFIVFKFFYHSVLRDVFSEVLRVVRKFSF